MKHLIFNLVTKTVTALCISALVLSSCSKDDLIGSELVGTWEGINPDEEAPDDFNEILTITLQQPIVDQQSGTWIYKIRAQEDCDENQWQCDYTFDCNGNFIFKSNEGNAYTFEESLTSGDCIDGGTATITVMDKETLQYEYVFGREVTNFTLSKI